MAGEVVKGRDRWPSRMAFIFASIGSAVGLGNVWRFPFLTYEYGGGTFLVPYLICLFVLGIPLLLLELILGQQFQKGDVEAFGSINKRLRGLGLGGILCGFLITTYYTNIIAWSCVYFVASFRSSLPWRNEAESYFTESVLRLAGEQQLDDGEARQISGVVYAGLIVTWAAIFGSVFQGVHTTGKVVYLTVPLPMVLLLVMLFYNATLDGAGDGIEYYIGKWHGSAFNNPTIWSAAAGQIFFSIGVSMGVMTAYGSFMPKQSDMVKDHLIIALTNSCVSFVAGFTVFTILGNLAHEQGVSVQEVSRGGVFLAFSTYPAGLANFPNGLAQFMSLLFFLTLFTLGIDSAFSLVEGVTTVIRDIPRFKHLTRPYVAGCVCLVGFFCSVLYATDLGLYLLDAVDHYISVYGLLLVAAVKCVAASWVYGFEDTKSAVGLRSARTFTAGYFLSIAMGVFFAGLLYTRDKPDIEPNTNLDTMKSFYFAVCLPVGVTTFLITTALAYTQRESVEMSFKDWYDGVIFAGTSKLRGMANAVGEEQGNWKLHWVWDVLIKYVNPALLTALIIVAVVGDATSEECEPKCVVKGYGLYPVWIHIVSIIVILAILMAIVAPILMPTCMDSIFGGECTANESKSPNNKTGNHDECELELSANSGDKEGNPNMI